MVDLLASELELTESDLHCALSMTRDSAIAQALIKHGARFAQSEACWTLERMDCQLSKSWGARLFLEQKIAGLRGAALEAELAELARAAEGSDECWARQLRAELARRS